MSYCLQEIYFLTCVIIAWGRQLSTPSAFAFSLSSPFLGLRWWWNIRKRVSILYCSLPQYQIFRVRCPICLRLTVAVLVEAVLQSAGSRCRRFLEPVVVVVVVELLNSRVSLQKLITDPNVEMRDEMRASIAGISVNLSLLLRLIQVSTTVTSSGNVRYTLWLICNFFEFSSHQWPFLWAFVN